MKKLIAAGIVLAMCGTSATAFAASNMLTDEEIKAKHEAMTDQELINDYVVYKDIADYMNGYITITEQELRERGIDPETLTEESYAGSSTYAAEFDDFKIELNGVSIKSKSGELYLVAEFKFTNTGAEKQCFAFAVGVEGYQDGIQLADGFLFDVETNAATYVQPGYSLDCRSVMKLRSTSQITLEVSPLFDFSHKYEPLKITINVK